MGTTNSWDARVAEFWASAGDHDPQDAIAAMRELVDERPAGDADATYEWASVYDFVGRESEAIPLYQEALANGLSGERYPQAMIQLASSLRNVGEAQEAVELLRARPFDAVTGDAAQAFLALALHDSGQSAAALRVALNALARTLPLYGRAVASYADDLDATDGGAEDALDAAKIPPYVNRMG